MNLDEDNDPLEDTDPSGELNFAVMILAAGSSSRMGRSKQLMEVDGEALLLHAIKVAMASGATDVVIVLGANEQNHLDLIKGLPVKITTNHFWKSGMGSSIKTGLHHIITHEPETQAVIITVCDQPAVRPEHLRQMIAVHKETKKSIVAASYADTIGVPALFSRTFFSNLLMMQDDHGAKKLIEQFQKQAAIMELPEGSIDLDTVEDYERYVHTTSKEANQGNVSPGA